MGCMNCDHDFFFFFFFFKDEVQHEFIVECVRRSSQIKMTDLSCFVKQAPQDAR